MSSGHILGPGSDLILVGSLQEQLNELGFDCGAPDNHYGEATVQAVRRFQKSVGLPVTGIVDGTTWQKVFNTTCVPSDLLEPQAVAEAAAEVKAEHSIGIDLQTRKLTLFQGSTVRGVYPVAVGKPTTPTPTGDHMIINKRMHPGGVFGSRWMGFTRRGHGIHGTIAPGKIGQAVSMGCVRMHNAHIERIFPVVCIGTPVIIRVYGAAPGKLAAKPLAPAPGDSGGKTATPPTGTGRVYIVRQGDSLWLIARRHGTSVEAIKTANSMIDDMIHPGQRLVIP